MQASKTLRQARGAMREDCLTKLSRVTFIAGLALMALCCFLEDAPFEWIAATGITGSVLALGSMWWTGWMDSWDGGDYDDSDNIKFDQADNG